MAKTLAISASLSFKENEKGYRKSMTLLEELNYLEQEKKQFWLKLKTSFCLSFVLFINASHIIPFDFSFLDFFFLKQEYLETYLHMQDYAYFLFGYTGLCY